MASSKYATIRTSDIKKPEISEHQDAVFVLHDQLNMAAWPDWVAEEKPLLLFVESVAKGRSLPYHKKKLTYVLSSMRHFAIECSQAGFPVWYIATTDTYSGVLEAILSDYSNLSLTYMEPSEWDSRSQLDELENVMEGRVKKIGNGFFLADADEWTDEIQPGYRMEYFYRDMRRKTGYLMDNDKPEGGEWNYDDQNREKLPKGYSVPAVTRFEADKITQEVMELVDAKFSDHFGEISHFGYAVTRKQALALLDEFIEQRLADFGPYEDAMADGEPLLFHSTLSLYLNNGLLLPKEVCDKAMEAYEQGEAPINSVEGLIRQIIGWREFIKIYYEAMMPEVRKINAMELSEDLPELYWTGDTEMRCLQQSVQPVIEQGYSHHIQRLMVLSNFSNLTETDPRQLNEWFWLAYVDAYEWVVLPNVLGMSTYADGGVLASKPYVSSGNYINKMSNYCRKCDYHISKKTGEKACPFNYLYWNFVDSQRDAFEQNGRSGFMVNMYEKKSDENKKAIRESSRTFLNNLERKSVVDWQES